MNKYFLWCFFQYILCTIQIQNEYSFWICDVKIFLASRVRFSERIHDVWKLVKVLKIWIRDVKAVQCSAFPQRSLLYFRWTDKRLTFSLKTLCDTQEEQEKCRKKKKKMKTCAISFQQFSTRHIWLISSVYTLHTSANSLIQSHEI